MDDFSLTVTWIGNQIAKIFTALGSVLVGQWILILLILGTLVSFYVSVRGRK